MKKHILIILLLTGLGANAQNRFYNLTTQFDSVKVRKLLMTSVQTGSTSDSLLTKKPNGGVFKIDRSSFIFNTTTPQTANISITGDISSGNYLKAGIGVKVAETVGFSTSSYAEFSNSRAKMGWNGTKGMIDIRGNDNSKSILFGGGADDYAVIFPTYFAPAITGGIALGNGSLYFSNAFLNDLRLAKTGLLKGNGTGANVSVAIAGTDYGTVSNFSKTDGFGIFSSVSNPTTTPVHTIAVDTTTIATKANSNTLAQLQTRLSAKANLNGVNTFDGSLQTYGSSGTARTYLNNNGLVVGSTTDSKAALVSSTGFGYRSATGTTISLIFPVSTVNRSVSYQDKDGTIAYTSDLSNYLVRTASGNGSSTTISIPHGLSGVTTSSYVTAMANNSASAGIQYVTVDSTNINIFYTVAPVSGTNNLLYSIEIKP